MHLAVEQADLVKGRTYPNPPVGAVILDRDGQVVGVGGTQRTGRAHADVVALLKAASAAVFCAVSDPNPKAAGGAARLAAAGVRVVGDTQADLVTAGPLREWLHKQRTGLPHVTGEYATRIDGRSAAADGSSQWITSEAAP